MSTHFTLRRRQPYPLRRKPHSRWFQTASLLSVALVAWLLFTIVRSRRLLVQSRTIAQQSAQFKRDYFVGNPAHTALEYLALGDSTAAGWGGKKLSETYVHQVAVALAAQGYRVRVINVAVGGARLQDVLRDQVPFLKSRRPQVVTVSVGANDATHFTSTTEFSQHLHSLIVALQESTAQKILFANTPDMYQAPALPLPLAIIANICARRQNAVLKAALQGATIHPVDLYNQGKLIYHVNPGLYAADQFHPSGPGYRRWAGLFIQELEPR